MKQTSTNFNPTRIFHMLLGILMISIAVAAFRLAGFGVDSFTCMNLGISGFLNMSFGNWQLIMNICILIIVFFTVRHLIGPGTIVNMVGVGYIADFLCWLILDALQIEMTIPLRLLAFVTALLICSFGAALYIVADLGIAPYDCVAFIITKLTHEKISFRTGRIISDVTTVILGLLFCLAANNDLWQIIGVGTLIYASTTGFLMGFFRSRIEQMPIYRKSTSA